MEVFTDQPNNARICPKCALFQWEDNGETQSRRPEKVDPEDLPEELR
jgi:hypothetical protein